MMLEEVMELLFRYARRGCSCALFSTAGRVGVLAGKSTEELGTCGNMMPSVFAVPGDAPSVGEQGEQSSCIRKRVHIDARIELHLPYSPINSANSLSSSPLSTSVSN